MPLSTWKTAFSVAILTFHSLSHTLAREARTSAKLDGLDTNAGTDRAGHHHELRSIPANHTLTRRDASLSLHPLIERDFPDPFLIKGTAYDEADGGGFDYHIFGGHGTQDKLNVQRGVVEIDKDLVAYTLKWDTLFKDAESLPKVGEWVFAADNDAAYDAHGVTSPFVYLLPGTSNYIMYYSAVPKSLAEKRWRCIGTATSISLTGGFIPDDDVWLCPENEGGASDASVFHDTLADRTYIIYKIDAQNTHTGTDLVDIPVMAQEVQNADASTKIGQPFKIYSSTRDVRWKKEKDLDSLRSPHITLRDNLYSLVYSTGPSKNPAEHVARQASSRAFNPSAFEDQGSDVVGSVYYTDVYKDATNDASAVSNWEGTIASRIEPEQYILVFNTLKTENRLRYVSACTLELRWLEDPVAGWYAFLLGRLGLGPVTAAGLTRRQ